MADEAKLCSPIHSTFEVLVVGHAVGVVMEKNWVLSVDQCHMEVLQFWVHFINLLSMLLRCNGFAGIQKAVVDQASSRSPNSDHDLFFGASLAFGSWSFFSVQPLSWSSLIVVKKSAFHHTSHTVKKWFIVVV